MKLASSPSRNSSITTRASPPFCTAPSDAPAAVSPSIQSIASCASLSVVATTTPLPAAKPSALITIGTPFASTCACASAASVKLTYSAVGMPWRCMKSFAKAFELSSRAAAWVGPKMRKPRARNTSTMPPASGASGPTTVRAIFSAWAKSASASKSVSATLCSAGSAAVPALPGATNTLCTFSDVFNFHASACSRPPPPMTKTFIRFALSDRAFHAVSF